MKNYRFKISETTFYTADIRAESKEKALEKYQKGQFLLRTRPADPEKTEILSIELIDGADKINKDVHTEHCCLTCGCKYSDPDCTVITEEKIQTYSHDQLCEVYYGR